MITTVLAILIANRKTNICKELNKKKQEQIFNAGREEAIKELQAQYEQSLNEKFLEYDSMMLSISEQLKSYQKEFE